MMVVLVLHMCDNKRYILNKFPSDFYINAVKLCNFPDRLYNFQYLMLMFFDLLQRIHIHINIPMLVIDTDTDMILQFSY